MNFFESRQILKKIIIAFLTVFLLQYIIPVNFTMADKDTEQEETEVEGTEVEGRDSVGSDWGGLLFSPIQNFLLSLGDVGVKALNLFIGGEGNGIISLTKKEGFIENMFDTIHTITTFDPISDWIYKNFSKPFAKHVFSEFTDDDFVNAITLPIITISPEEIFSNQIPLLDVNIINPKKYTYEDEDGKKQEVKSTAAILQSTISAWYRVLKDIATVLLLSVLVYIGIRIVISSVASDKAKYKKMLIDWIVGLCLLFTVHYIMSFAFTITDKFVELLSSTNEVITIESANDDVDLSDYKIGDKEKVIEKYNIDDDGNYVSDKLSWRTNFIGYVRFYAQTNIKSMSVALRFAYTLMYLILVIYTYMFLFQYIKRLMYIVFLTLMAPIMAVLYPIQKASGKTPSTTKYIKDWGNNLSLILVHSILYKVLMGTSMDLVTSNPLYGVLVLASIMEAGKIFKQYLDTQGGTATADDATNGLVTGALVMQGVKSVAGMAKGLGSGSNKKESSGGGRSNVRLANNRTSRSEQDDDDLMDRALGSRSNNSNLNSGSSNNNSGSGSGDNTNEGNNNSNVNNMNGNNNGSDARNMNVDNNNPDSRNMDVNNNNPDSRNMDVDNNNLDNGNMDVDNNNPDDSNINTGNIDYNLGHNNQGQGTDQLQQDSNTHDGGDRTDYLHRLAQEVEDGNPIVSPLPNESGKYDNPALERWAKEVDDDESDNTLHRRDSENYDEYGNYLSHDGRNGYNNNPNLQRWAKEVDNDKNGNVFHKRDPEHYDKYGNYAPRDGRTQANGKNKKIKSKPAGVRDKVVAAKDKAKNVASNVANSNVGKEVAGRVRYYAPKLGKTALKATLAAAGAVTLGTVGLAAGAATKDNKDMITYGLGAATAGMGVGSALGNTLANYPSIKDKVQQRRNDIKREVYKNDPEGYERYLNNQADKEFMRDKEIRRQYTEAFGASDAREMMNYALTYRDHGITDDKLIIKAMKEKSGEIGKTDSPIDDKRIAAAKLASGISNSKDIENMTKRLHKKGYEQNVIDQNEEFVRSIKGFKYN